MHIQRLANAWSTHLNTPPQELAEQPEGATAMNNKKQEILHYTTIPINLECEAARDHQPAISGHHNPSPVDLEATTEAIPDCQGSPPQRTHPEPKLPPTSSTYS
jgi:hypothetical protein